MRVNGTCGGLISGYSQLHNCNIWQRYCAANYAQFLAQTQFEKVPLKSSVENMNITIKCHRELIGECVQRTTVITGAGFRINLPCLTWPDKCKDSILEGC